ncbi:MAG TPA: fused MFS/spermidine synthase [Bryobacteraceae bacterium]|nr:fused MFS/spermidine synthase [Bryobacteraceae bacterium]
MENANRGEVAPGSAPSFHVSKRFLPALLLLFAGSGCSALIYEVVWYQLLQLVIGSTAISLGVLLASFMGGLCLGSFALPRLVSGRLHPLRIYAWIELGIGMCGLAALFGVPLVDRLYVAGVGHGVPAVLLRALVCAACLMPPTILMGASLPAAARWVETSPEGVSWLGLLYGANTAGAVAGCVLAGFYLLRVYDMATATYVAAALNAMVALVSLALAGRAAYHASSGQPDRGQAAAGSWPVYWAIALSGACALGAEVIWTRLLGLLLGATVYTFSIILAVFLVGIGLGSGAGSLLARSLTRPRLALGWCQMLLTAGIAWTAYMLANSLPYWPINPLLSTEPIFTFQVDLVRCLWTILPAALLWGASFPLALAAVAAPGEDPGRMVGGIYAANTAGAILGALSFSMLLIPRIGTGRSERALIVLSAIGGLLLLTPLAWTARRKSRLLALTAAASLAAVWLVSTVTPVPGMLIAYGRRMITSAGRAKILYVGEGMNSSIAISQWDDGAVQFHVSGKVEASTEPYDMRLQRMLGHVPGLFHPAPKSALVVGFGAGVTAGSFTLYPSIQRIVICEMEPLVPPIATIFFARQNYDVLHDRRARVVYDDARHYILTSPEKFDIITSDPIHPWVKGSATLYSKEYFDLVKQHLNPGGIVTQWVPLYESDLNTVKSEIATFFDVFPDGTIWGNENGGGGYDIVLLGNAGEARIDVDGLEHRLGSAAYSGVSKSLQEVGFQSAMALLTTYAGRASDLRTWLARAQINRDGNLRLQYLAGLALNGSQETLIYDQMLSYRKYPDGLFQVSEARLPALRAALAGR